MSIGSHAKYLIWTMYKTCWCTVLHWTPIIRASRIRFIGSGESNSLPLPMHINSNFNQTSDSHRYISLYVRVQTCMQGTSREVINRPAVQRAACTRCMYLLYGACVWQTHTTDRHAVRIITLLTNMHSQYIQTRYIYARNILIDISRQSPMSDFCQFAGWKEN